MIASLDRNTHPLTRVTVLKSVRADIVADFRYVKSISKLDVSKRYRSAGTRLGGAADASRISEFSSFGPQVLPSSYTPHFIIHGRNQNEPGTVERYNRCRFAGFVSERTLTYVDQFKTQV